MTSAATVAQLSGFDEIIDVRTPAEFAEDHIPGAINLPVLSTEERARVGTLYKQVSPFVAKKLGAALIARNIATHLERALADKPREWRPLVYCWRGGKRSGSMAHVLAEVGWKAARLEGGYKAYRRHVIEALAALPQRLRFCAICGPTGSGKSRFLAALAQAGAQVLDLEGLARHRGSVLGHLPHAPQPAQKMFESLIWERLERADPAQPIYVEAESKKIGALRVPDALMAAMWQGECVLIEVSPAQRVQLLKEDYAHFMADPAALLTKVEWLRGLHGADRLGRWRRLAEAGAWDEFVLDLLVQHYDPAYRRSTLKHYPHLGGAIVLRPRDVSMAGYAALAREFLAASAIPRAAAS